MIAAATGHRWPGCLALFVLLGTMAGTFAHNYGLQEPAPIVSDELDAAEAEA